MPSFSPFWYKHYKDIGFCCTLQPLQESPTGYTKDDPYVVTFIDTQWIADKKLKWIGTDRRGEAAWIDPQGMVYNFNELKRNEKGKEYENGGKKLEIEDQSITQYGDNKKDFYEWELEILKTCGFCHNHRPDPTPDREDEERGGTAKVETEDDAWQDIMNGSSSDLDIVTETGDVAFSGHVTDADDVADAGNFADQNYNEGYANEQGQIPGEENNAYIPPVPYKPPVPFPTEDATPPPPPRPRVVPPMNENPVLMSRKLVTDNSRATKTPFKMPKEEELTKLVKGYPTKNQKEFADEIIEREKAKVKRESGKGDVLIRVVYEGARKPDGDHDDVVIEQDVQKGDPNKPKEVYQIYVKGLTDDGGLTAGGSINRHWITEQLESNNPVGLIPPQLLTTKKIPWEPVKTRPNTTTPPKEYKIPPIPVPTFPYIKPLIPPPSPIPLICLACFLGMSEKHVFEERIAIMVWLRTNPDYDLELTVDGSVAGGFWSTIVDGITASERVELWFNNLVSFVQKGEGAIEKRLRLKFGNPRGSQVEGRAIRNQ